MGLDMYLHATRYIGGWRHQNDDAEKKLYDKLAKLSGITPTEHSPSFELKATVGYWRKANAIHNWFVEKVQDGNDKCQESDVSREQLQELKDACNQVLNTIETVPGDVAMGTTYHASGEVEYHTKPGEVVAQKQIAADILPTRSGVFFGETDYDEHYLEGLRDTVSIIDRCLAMPNDWAFTYHASW